MTAIPIGYTRNYRQRHHPVTALLTIEEFNEFTILAAKSGMSRSAFLTKIAKLYVQEAANAAIEAVISEISEAESVLDGAGSGGERV